MLQPSTLDAVLDLLRPDERPAAPDVSAGYLDLLGASDPTGAHPGQRLMAGSVLPVIYERWWRPLGGRVLMGAMGPGMDGERRMALDMLDLHAGDAVLDVGCGPGNFTRSFARPAAPGVVVGLDASATMLARAVHEPTAANVAYVRGDACRLPFADGTFDAVCCFAALYLIEDPQAAIAEIARVLRPGGRVALLASCHRGPLPLGPVNAAVRTTTGVRMFGRDQLTHALHRHGLVDLDQRVTGVAQFVSATAPDAERPRVRRASR